MLEYSANHHKRPKRSKAIRPRPEVAACYDHLGGVLGAVLLKRLVELGWVQADWMEGGRTANEHITTAGLEGLAAWGVDVARLDRSTRKPVAVCWDHAGALLGVLLREWLEQQGWIEKSKGVLRLTNIGRNGLATLGCQVGGGAYILG